MMPIHSYDKIKLILYPQAKDSMTQLTLVHTLVFGCLKKPFLFVFLPNQNHLLRIMIFFQEDLIQLIVYI